MQNKCILISLWLPVFCVSFPFLLLLHGSVSGCTMASRKLWFLVQIITNVQGGWHEACLDPEGWQVTTKAFVEWQWWECKCGYRERPQPVCDQESLLRPWSSGSMRMPWYAMRKLVTALLWHLDSLPVLQWKLRHYQALLQPQVW